MKLSFDEKLGRGAFAAVWRAVDALGRHVAVKFFTDPTPSQVEQQALTHARALARVRHPAIVQVLAVEEQPHPESGLERMAIVMEYVPGTSLSLSKAKLDAIWAKRIFADLAAGLQAIHDAGLVHADLHDANVMIHQEGATLLDILYTHSLAEVGTRTAQRSREQDLRDLAKVCRQVLERVDVDRSLAMEAYYAADAAGSPALVVAPFVAVLEAAVLPSADAAEMLRADALDLLTRLQSRSEPLSALLPAICARAGRAGHTRLAALCESELTGYDAPTDEATQREPDENIAHRVLTFYIGQGVAINPDFFATGQAAMDYMRRHPNNFVPRRIMYPRPLSTIERQLAERPAEALVVLTTAAAGTGYADGDTFHRIVEGVRARLSAGLLLISKNAGPR